MRAMLVMLFVVGCGGGSKPTATTTMPKETGASCGSVADSMVAMMMVGKEGMGNVDEVADGFRQIIRVRCEDDTWSTEAKQCLATMKTREDAERCGPMLTEEQQSNLVRDQKAKYGAAENEAAGAAPPAPAGPTPMTTKKPGDPCDGGE